MALSASQEADAVARLGFSKKSNICTNTNRNRSCCDYKCRLVCCKTILFSLDNSNQKILFIASFSLSTIGS